MTTTIAAHCHDIPPACLDLVRRAGALDPRMAAALPGPLRDAPPHVIEPAGADRPVPGGDRPFGQSHPDLLASVRADERPPPDRDAIAAGNARRPLHRT